MLQRSCGTIPIDSKRKTDENVIDATKQLASPQTYGSLVVDTMDFGKNYTGLLYLSYYALCAEEGNIDPNSDHKPKLTTREIQNSSQIHTIKAAISQFSICLNKHFWRISFYIVIKP